MRGASAAGLALGVVANLKNERANIFTGIYFFNYDRLP
jgi:hypothetical protein